MTVTVTDTEIETETETERTKEIEGGGEREFVVHSLKTLPQRSGKFSETPCTPCLPSAKRPGRLTIALTPSLPK